MQHLYRLSLTLILTVTFHGYTAETWNEALRSGKWPEAVQLIRPQVVQAQDNLDALGYFDAHEAESPLRMLRLMTASLDMLRSSYPFNTPDIDAVIEHHDWTADQYALWRRRLEATGTGKKWTLADDGSSAPVSQLMQHDLDHLTQHELRHREHVAGLAAIKSLSTNKTPADFWKRVQSLADGYGARGLRGSQMFCRSLKLMTASQPRDGIQAIYADGIAEMARLVLTDHKVPAPLIEIACMHALATLPAQSEDRDIIKSRADLHRAMGDLYSPFKGESPLTGNFWRRNRHTLAAKQHYKKALIEESKIGSPDISTLYGLALCSMPSHGGGDTWDAPMAVLGKASRSDEKYLRLHKARLLVWRCMSAKTPAEKAELRDKLLAHLETWGYDRGFKFVARMITVADEEQTIQEGQKALQYYEAFIQKWGDEDHDKGWRAEILFKLGMAWLPEYNPKGDYMTAYRYFYRCLKLEPDTQIPYRHHQLAYTLQKIDDHDRELNLRRAVRHYCTAITLAGSVHKKPWSAYRLAECLTAQGNDSEALDVLTEAMPFLHDMRRDKALKLESTLQGKLSPDPALP